MKIFNVLIAVLLILLIVGCAQKAASEKRVVKPGVETKPVPKVVPTAQPAKTAVPVETTVPAKTAAPVETTAPVQTAAPTTTVTINTDELDQLTNDIASGSDALANTPDGDISADFGG
jgi:PBP1b-binding outer membrane lipoprotein LpoB